MKADEFYCIGWPDGSEALCELVQRHIPAVTEEQMRPLAFALLGYPDLEGCLPVQNSAEADLILGRDSTLIALIVQALSARVEAALYETSNVEAVANCHRAVKVIRAATHYMPGGACDE
jgi:hypothetical protein